MRWTRFVDWFWSRGLRFETERPGQENDQGAVVMNYRCGSNWKDKGESCRGWICLGAGRFPVL